MRKLILSGVKGLRRVPLRDIKTTQKAQFEIPSSWKTMIYENILNENIKCIYVEANSFAML